MKAISGGRGRARLAAIGAAGAIAIVGLVLAVGAGARSGKSVRDASYPVSYIYKMDVVEVSRGVAKSARDAAFKRDAKFKFHMVYKAGGGKPPHSVTKYIGYKCSVDKRKARGCSSPKSYSGLDKGKHKFGVQALYKGTDSAATAVKKVKFKVK